jgi:hypothetical protein
MHYSDFIEAKRFICADIEREIRLAYASQRDDFKVAVQPFAIPLGGANFLAAMGLLSYTEFAGKLKYNEKKKNGKDCAKQNFNRFFDDLGLGYKQFRASCPDVYDIFRCGLVMSTTRRIAATYICRGNRISQSALASSQAEGTIF